MFEKKQEVEFECLTKEIADEYYKRAQKLDDNGIQDAGKRYELRRELQKRCGITEIEAVNILNGRNTADYVQNALIRHGIVQIENTDKKERQRLIDQIADLEARISADNLVDADMD